MSHDPRVRVGAAAWIAKEHPTNGLSVLLMERAGSHGAGTLGLPGGWVDYYESPKRTVVREVQEELNVTVVDPRFIGFTTDIWQEEEMQVITFFYSCRLLAGEPIKIMEPEKCVSVEWVPVVHLRSSRCLFKPLENFINQYGWYHFQ